MSSCQWCSFEKNYCSLNLQLYRFLQLPMKQEQIDRCWGNTSYIPPIERYDPETFQSREFRFQEGETLSRVDLQGKTRTMETDAVFVRSMEETCWRQFGYRREESQLTEEECEEIHNAAERTGKKAEMSDLGLVCDDLIEHQFLTYDNTFFFFFMKVLFLNALIMTLGYALPALVRYGQGTRYLTNNLFSCVSSYCQFIDRFSMYNEEKALDTFTLLEYLGLGMIAILQIIFFLTWKYNKEIREVIRYEERCYERSLLIKGLPEGQYCQGDILRLIQFKSRSSKEELNNTGYQEIELVTFDKGGKRNHKKSSMRDESHTSKAVLDDPAEGKDSIYPIKGIQVFYDLSKSKKMIEQIEQACKEIWQITANEPFEGRTVVVVLDEENYKKKKQQIIRLYKQLRTWRRQFLEDSGSRRKYSLGSTILHFENREDRDRLLQFLKTFYQLEWINSWGSFEPCIKDSSVSTRENENVRLKDYQLKVGLAPQPENIVWQNVEHTYGDWLNNHSKCRIAMVLVPLVHVGIIIGLQIVKIYLGQTKSSANTILSLLVTIGIVAVNQLLWIFLQLAVRGQELRLLTSYQVYMNYAGFASTTLSIILAPLVVQYAWRGRYFGSLAMVGIATEYQLSTVLTVPLLFVVSPAEIIMKVVLGWSKLRNYLIRSTFETEEGQRLRAIFKMYERSEFDVSVSYAFLMANFLHATFFSMVAPMVIPLFALQILLFYWACKVRMLKFCKFPQLVRRWLMGIVFANLLVSPLFFAAGCLISEHAYQSHVVALDHVPIGTYLLFALWAFFSIFSLILDTKLQKTKIFGWVNLVDNFKSLKDLEASRNKEYPSRSTSYFIGSNVLNLLGFEKAIMGTTRNRKAEELHEKFCQEQASGDYAGYIKKLNELEAIK